MINDKKYSVSYVSTQIIILLLFMVLSGLLSMLLRQYLSWDFKNYHWYNAYAFLNNRINFDIAPAQLQSYFNPLLNILNYCIIKSVQNPLLIAFIFGAPIGIIIYLIMKIAILLFSEESRIALRRFYITFAMIIGLTGPAFLSQFGIAFTETEVALLILFSLYICLRIIGNKDDKKNIILICLSGLVLGISIGLKLTSAIYAFPLFIACLFQSRSFHRNFWLFIFMSLSALIGFLIIDGFWMIKMYHYFQNPMFPFYNGIFKSPYAENASYKDIRFLPQNIWQYLFYPFFWLKTNKYVTDAPFRDFRFAILMLLGISCIGKNMLTRILKKPTWIRNNLNRNQQWRFLLIFFVTSYLIWLVQFSIERYLIPIEVLSGIVIMYFFNFLFRSNQTKVILILAITILVISTERVPHYGYFPNFIVKVPQLPKEAMVILAGGDPISYIIPFFQPNIRFVAIYNTLMNPQNKNLLQKRAKDLIEQHVGSLFLVQTSDNNIKSILKHYNLEVIVHQCWPIYSSLERHPIQICRIKKQIKIH